MHDQLTICIGDLGTGGITVEELELQLVAEATKYVQAIAVLPTSEEDERLVDGFMRRVRERRSESI